MSYGQHLPNYRHDFLEDMRFVRADSPHYRFHYFPGSEAEKDIERIIASQEAAFAKILDFLELPPPDRKIEYYLYPDEATKTALMGDDWYAQSIYDEFRIHVLYTSDIKPIGPHEDTHLLSLPWNVSIGFFQEGLAEYLTGNAWDGMPHLMYVRKGYEEQMFPSLEVFLSHEGWQRLPDADLIYFYSLAGAFTAFLVEQYGKVAYKRFYQASSRENDQAENAREFLASFGETAEQAEEKFKGLVLSK